MNLNFNSTHTQEVYTCPNLTLDRPQAFDSTTQLTQCSLIVVIGVFVCLFVCLCVFVHTTGVVNGLVFIYCNYDVVRVSKVSGLGGGWSASIPVL